ncbi:MAG: hypothetical protein GYB46_04730 [Rhodobacteraceae bacterium]|nr:hypothetical protein [Paracoccaceae bacterium]
MPHQQDVAHIVPVCSGGSMIMATQDGKIGPKTLSMVFNMEPATLLDKYAEAREAYYRSLKTFEIYGRGWLRRNDEVLAKAKLLAQ